VLQAMSRRIKYARYGSRILLAVGIGLIVYLFIYRPLQINWGAGNDEVQRMMPGDDIVQSPTFNATRAVTVNAEPEQIWPWLVQMGHTRAGWYSYDLVDNLGRVSAERIIPEYQHLQPGDLVPISPDGKMGFRVKDFDPNRWMLWWDGEGGMTWVWGLYSIDEKRSRLISRVRMRYNWLSPGIVLALALDVGDFIMMRQCMIGIKSRAEGRRVESLIGQTVELFLWILSFIGFVIAEVWIIVKKDWRRPLILALAAAVITILLVMWKPPIWCDGLFVVFIFIGLWWTRRWDRKSEVADDGRE